MRAVCERVGSDRLMDALLAALVTGAGTSGCLRESPGHFFSFLTAETPPRASVNRPRKRSYFEHFWNDFPRADRTRPRCRRHRRIYTERLCSTGRHAAPGFRDPFSRVSSGCADFARFAQRRYPSPCSLPDRGRSVWRLSLIQQAGFGRDDGLKGVARRAHSGHWLHGRGARQVIPQLPPPPVEFRTR